MICSNGNGTAEFEFSIKKFLPFCKSERGSALSAKNCLWYLEFPWSTVFKNVKIDKTSVSVTNRERSLQSKNSMLGKLLKFKI